MILWRLVPARWMDSALDGQGAALAGGRWNTPGLKAVYLSLDPATPVLETLTTFSRSACPPGGFKLLRVEYTGSTQAIEVRTLPAGWNRPDDATVARAFGSRLLREQQTGLLIVPSVVLPVACNAVLNPLHPDAARARVLEALDFTFDPRWPLR